MAQSSVLGKEELIAKFRAMGEAAQGDALADATLTGGAVIRNAAIENIKSQGLVRTRNLSRSMHEEIEDKTPQRAVVAIGTNVVYGPIHEFGGTITARKGKYLAIPIGSYRGSPREHGDLRLRKTARGNLIMVDASGTPQYVLKTSVEIPARPYLRPAYDEKQVEAQNTLGAALRDVILKAAGV